MDGGYITVAGEYRAEILVNRSRFLAIVINAEDEAAAREFLAAVKKEHYSATHVCYAYSLPGNITRFSDAGEPQGTAGQPILEAIKRSGLSNTVIAVARWFGGVKLGAGGLTRAYSAAAVKAAAEAPKAEYRLMETLEFTLSFSAYKMYEPAAKALNAVQLAREYGELVVCREAVLPGRIEPFKALIRDVSGGKSEASLTGSGFFKIN